MNSSAIGRGSRPAGGIPAVNPLATPVPGARGKSWASSAATRRTMQGCRGRDTSTELALRSAVHALGLRYRVDARPVAVVRRKADLVFSTERLAVFLDGCFWHGCERHYTAPVAHADYWRAKLGDNRRRDRETDLLLAAQGWTVLRIWEHEDPVAAAKRVRDALFRLRRRAVVIAKRRSGANARSRLPAAGTGSA